MIFWANSGVIHFGHLIIWSCFWVSCERPASWLSNNVSGVLNREVYGLLRRFPLTPVSPT